jgi:IclR family transcriptional regulator, KDG regulon repressor
LILSGEKKSTVRAAERALDILLCFVDETRLGMTEIAERTGLNKSTVFRLLATLESKGFVKRDPDTEKYQLGFRIWELSAHLNRSKDPAVLFLPEMERLRDELDETVSLYVYDGIERIRIQAVESNQAIRRVAPVGVRMPLTVGASSKVLVAFADPALLQKVLAESEWPDHVEKSEYLNQLKQIRKDGYAVSIEEREAGTAAVAVPIFSRREKLVAALAVSGPVSRMNVDKMEQFVPYMMEAAGKMGKMIGD